MRAWLFVLAVLATLNTVQQVASTEEVKSSSTSTQSPSTTQSTDSSALDNNNNNYNNYNNNNNNHNNIDNNKINNNKNIHSDNQQNIIDKDNSNSNQKADKPDPQTLVQIEKNLLSLFGFSKRPKVDRSKIVIPEAMKQLYAQIMGHELDSLNVPKADLHKVEANTVRSYTHEGKFLILTNFFLIIKFQKNQQQTSCMNSKLFHI